MTRLEAKRTMVVLALCGGCGPGRLGDLPTDSDSDGASADAWATDSVEGGADATSAGDDPGKGEWYGVQLTTNKDVDILFVIDNSSSMAGSQANLAANIPGFVELLEAGDVMANLRIAVTTTDLGNPSCTTTSPEDGAFVASSCQERISDFGEASFEAGCLDYCSTASLPFVPTTTALDPEAKPRPWIEVIEGTSNVPGISTLFAALCLLPQGDTGCEFVSPFEAARRALERARTPSDPAYGFLRDKAHLAIVFVTDGDDCSSPFDQRAIFLRPEECYDADGDGDDTDDCTQVFWTEPGAPSPTPAVCWNAGVQCSGAMPQGDGTTSFESCVAMDKDLNGNATTPAEAVLHPVDGYAQLFGELRQEKAEWSAGLLVTAVTGVPFNAGLPIPFATSTDPGFNVEYGIGPACDDESSGRFATPPVRLQELLSRFYDGPDQLFGFLASICNPDYQPALDPIASLMRDQVKPACVPACVADLDPGTATLDFDCEVQQISPPDSDPIVVSVPECLADDAMPADSDVCWVALTGDDLDPFCTDQGYNLQLGILRREGRPAPGGTTVEISCVWTDPIDGACPG